jgi:hypothetical protein
MNTAIASCSRRAATTAAAVALAAVALAFPPSPPHTFTGLVRDALGDPLAITNAVVILETTTGVRVKAALVPYLGPGFNYRLEVPMDAGLTADAYRPTALRPTVPFTIKVQIGSATYLPMELQGRYAALGRPAQTTRLDLTLGEDSDSDGLPDAWERALIAMLGADLSLAEIRPEDDADGDGLTNLQEYLASTYAFDPADGLRLDLAGLDQGRPQFEFLAIRGRTYGILVSTNLSNWAPVMFRPVGSTADVPLMDAFVATDVRTFRVEAAADPPTPAIPTVFRLMAR